MLRLATVALALLAIPSAFAQLAISVRSGLIHQVEGKASVDGEPVQLNFGKFPVVKEGKTLATDDGRVELLLTPGVFLRLDRNSSVKMLSSALSNTLVEIPRGAALVEVVELGKEHRVAVKLADSETLLSRSGLYQFDASLGQVRVYEGKAQVSLKEESIAVGKGHSATVGSGLTAGKFDAKDTDSLYEWSQERAYLIARANVGAASSFKSNGYQMSTSGWAWNPDYGLLTFLPRSGYYRGGFGLGYYSPGSVWQYYNSGYYQNQNGYSGNRGGSVGNQTPAWSGLGSSGPSSSASSMGSAGMGGRASAPASAPAVSSSGGRGR
jgi:hypothetical protein